MNAHDCRRYIGFPTADLVPTGTENLEQGVMQANHHVYISLSNLSSVVQTIDISVLPGSTFNATFYGLPSPVTRTMGNGVSPAFTAGGIALAPDQSTVVEFMSICSYAYNRCCLQAVGAVNVGPNCMANNEPSANAAYGVARASSWNFEVRVREARGAVAGSITTQVHRHGGMKDKSQGETIIMLNGGRPF